jgi:hypothetical protein
MSHPCAIKKPNIIAMKVVNHFTGQPVQPNIIPSVDRVTRKPEMWRQTTKTTGAMPSLLAFSMKRSSKHLPEAPRS